MTLDPIVSQPTWTIGGFIIVWLLVAAYLLTLLITKDQRTLYDLMAGTVVVKTDIP